MHVTGLRLVSESRQQMLTTSLSIAMARKKHYVETVKMTPSGFM